MFAILVFTDWFVLTRADWAALVIASGTVIAGELFNTAIENAVNHTSEKYSEFAKRAKDAAAGGVLISAIFAVITGLIIMLQPEAFAAMYLYFKDHIGMLCLLVLSLIPTTLFIFLGFPKRKK